MPRYLVVANETLQATPLLELVRSRSIEEGASFHVVVPATPPKGWRSWSDGQAHAIAAERLAAALGRYRGLGVRADGEVGDAAPLLAVADALSSASYDAIVLSTLPVGISRWLRMDMPSRMRASFPVPVLHVEATVASDLVA